MNNYIKIYKDITGLDWDTSCFDVHHINMNRKDNSINNLTLLPKRLHKQYHYWSQFYFRYKDFLEPKNLDWCSYNNAIFNIEKNFEKFLELKNDVVILTHLKEYYLYNKFSLESSDVIETYKDFPYQIEMLERNLEVYKDLYLKKLKELDMKYNYKGK